MFNIDSFRVSDSPETKKPALFKTADNYAYEVHPCACLFAGKPHAGKSIYLPYAVNRWKNYHEAFGLFPTTEIHPVCFALDRGESIPEIECIDPFSVLGKLSCTVFSQLIEQLCTPTLVTYKPVNVIFIDNLRALCSHLNGIPQSLQVSDQQAFIGDFLSKLAARLGVYIFVLMHLSKSKDRVTDIQDAILGTNGIVGSYHGACYITEKTNSYIDLLFDWRSKIIKRRVLFGDGLNELTSESADSLFERLEEKKFEKYGGYGLLREFLSQFKNGPVPIRNLMSSMNISSTKKIMNLIKQAREDEYLFKESARSSYQLTKKGWEVVEAEEIVGSVKNLISSSDLELFYRFTKEILGRERSRITPQSGIFVSTYSKWKIWKEKNSDPAVGDKAMVPLVSGEKSEMIRF
jgi:predicted transcriptional regulator